MRRRRRRNRWPLTTGAVIVILVFLAMYGGALYVAHNLF